MAMREEDAKVVMGILLKADGGCGNCAETLTEYFVQAYPGFAELAVEAYTKEFGHAPRLTPAE